MFSLFSHSYFYCFQAFKLSSRISLISDSPSREFLYLYQKSVIQLCSIPQYFYIQTYIYCMYKFFLTLFQKKDFFGFPIQMNQEICRKERTFLQRLKELPTACVQLCPCCVELHFTFHFSCALCTSCSLLSPSQGCDVKDSSITFISLFLC